MLIFYEGIEIPDKSCELFSLSRIDLSEKIPKINELDPYYLYGSEFINSALYMDDIGEFDMWYYQYLTNNPQHMKIISDIIISMMNFEYTVIYCNNQPYGVLIAESIMRFLNSTYGIQALYIPYTANLTEELMEVEESFQNFSLEGSEAVKNLINTYSDGMVRVTEEELEMLGDDICDI